MNVVCSTTHLRGSLAVPTFFEILHKMICIGTVHKCDEMHTKLMYQLLWFRMVIGDGDFQNA